MPGNIPAMEVSMPAGRYVLAVSGGVDSMVLLHILSTTDEVELIVAHFNHGIRQDSDKDEELVKDAAKQYGLQIEIANGKLGPTASEEQARTARYKFLNSIQKKYKAVAIITAHHEDDL